MSKLKLQATDGNGGTVSLKGPASTTGNAEFELTLPGNAGSNGQVLATNGSGVLTWSNDANVGGATGVDFNDSVKARWGTGNDLEIYHNGTHSYIKNKTGDFYLQATDTEIGINILPNSRVELYYDNSKKFETSSTGGILRGTLWTAVDNTKIAFGTGDDLQIYHDGSTSRIKHDGTGDLSIQANKLWLGNSGLTEVYAELTQNGAVELRYDNSKKLETTSDGISVTGSVSPDDALKLGDERYVKLGASADFLIGHSPSSNWNLFRSSSSSLKVSFQKVSEKWLEMIPDQSVDIYYDGSKKLETTSTGIAVTGQAVATGNSAKWETVESGGGSVHIQSGGSVGYVGTTSNHPLVVRTNNAEKLRIDSTGKVLIGTTTAGLVNTADNLTIEDSATGGVTIRSGSTSYGNLFFADSASGLGSYAGYVQYKHDGDELRLGVASNDRLTMDGSGDITIPNGNLKVASGHGIDFSATGDATGKTSELLDDYEEGVVTATCSNSVTLHSTDNTFSYTKVGRLVTLMGQLRVNSDNSNATFTITNIPFTSADLTDGADHAAGACRLWSWDINVANHVGVMAFLGGGSTVLSFYVNRDGQSAESLPASAGGYIGFSITYAAA
jgi:hypothetical protein